MDIQMPDMDGFQTTKKIIKLLADHQFQGCSIVALTANTTSETAQKAIQSGMKEVYNKPLTEEKLKKVLQKYYH